MSAAAAATPGTETLTVDRTEAEAEAEVESITYSNTLTATEAAARFIGRDLRYLVQKARVPLAEQLRVPREMTRNDGVVVELLLHDIERMLRHNLISAVHLMLSDRSVNANAQYSVRYHARYEVLNQAAQVTLRSGVRMRNDTGSWSDVISAPSKVLANAHFTLGISWRPRTSRERRRSARQPEYFFTWLPDGRNYDQLGLVGYRFGGINTSVVQIVRIEYARPDQR
jgi:hypothetical protein